MNEISFNWKNIFTNLILLVILVVILAFGFKNNFSFSSNNNDVLIDRVFNENIQTMKDAAKDYYTVDRLPSEIGDIEKLSLQQMLDKKMLLNFTDKNNNTCNTEFSYVEVTKLTETEYQLKVMLACGEQMDYIVDTIGCYDTCEDSNCKVETKTEYQFTKTTAGTKTTYSCPEGYSLNGKYCYKQLDSSIKATALYSDATTKVTDAKKSNDETYKEYTNAIATAGKTTYKCEKGTLNSDNTCTVTSSTTVNATPVYSYKCASGTLQSDNTCKISSTTNATPVYSYKCASGTLQSNNTCKITTTKTVNAEITSYSYGSWYVVTSYKRTSALSTYNNGTEKLVDNGTTREYSCGTPTYCPTKVTYYHYTLYRRTATPKYSCSTGTLSGTKCNVTTTTSAAATKYISSYKCSTGTLSGTKCNVTTSTAATKYISSYKCTSGTLSGTKCTVSANSKIAATPIVGATTYSCPSGYNKEGSGSTLKCYVTRTNTGLYYCDGANQTLDGDKCYEYVKSQLTGYTCKDGYTLEGNTCVKTCNKKIDATATTSNTSKTSTKWSEEKTLSGYTSTGKYRIVDEDGKVIKTGTIEEVENKVVSTDDTNTDTTNDDTKLMTVNTDTDSTPSTMEYIMYAIIIIGVVIMAFASITMIRVKRYNN